MDKTNFNQETNKSVQRHPTSDICFLTSGTRGITLIALIITIIVTLILIGVSVHVTVGEGGIFYRASESVFKTELSRIKEDLEIFKAEKKVENVEFEESSLTAHDEMLEYNTKNVEEGGNIYTVLGDVKDKHRGRLEIIKGILYYTPRNEREKKWLKDIDIEQSPYIIDSNRKAIIYKFQSFTIRRKCSNYNTRKCKEHRRRGICKCRGCKNDNYSWNM